MRVVACCFALVLLVAGTPVAARADLASHFGGQSNLTLVIKAPVVKAWRSAGSLEAPDYYGEKLWKKSGDPVLVASNHVFQLKKVLLDERTYLESATPKEGVSWPVVIINFVSAEKTLEVYLSFRNNSMAVKIGTEKFGLPLLLDSDIDSGRKEILTVVKKLFPADKSIQEIPE